MYTFFNHIVKVISKKDGLNIPVVDIFGGSSQYSSKNNPSEETWKNASKKFEIRINSLKLEKKHVHLCLDLMDFINRERDRIRIDELIKAHVIPSGYQKELVEDYNTLSRLATEIDNYLNNPNATHDDSTHTQRTLSKNTVRKFLCLTFSYAFYLSHFTPVEIRDVTAVYGKKNIIGELISKTEGLTKDKPASPKLDNELIEQLKSIGAEVETEEELYVMLMNFSLRLLEEGTDDDFAFSWLDELYDNPDLQDNICGFAITLYDKEDYSRAFKIFLGLANQGHTTAQMFLGDCYHYGKGVEANLGIAYNWYAKVADIKDDESVGMAQMGLVMCLLEMSHADGNEFLLQLAISTAQKYAELGNAQVQYVLACAYKNGNGVAKNDSLAHFWMSKAAKGGLLDAIKIINNEKNNIKIID